MKRHRLVRVAASSANLGPGFDALAAALQMHMELEVEETGSFAVHTDAELPTDRSNLCVRGFERLHPADGFEFTIRTAIPLVGGLGTSAAATVAGLMAADHVFELDADLLALATELEGHPDNAAAALMGGFVVCTGATATRFDIPAGLEALVVVPSEPVATAEARAVLPEQVPLADAVFNVAHASLLTLGLARGEWDLVARGLHDRLHEPHRAHLYPRSVELAQRAREVGALGATISGAGPTVLVWTHYEQTAGVFEGLRRAAGGDAQVVRVPFETQGAEVRAL
jgi:homoserine kinase